MIDLIESPEDFAKKVKVATTLTRCANAVTILRTKQVSESTAQQFERELQNLIRKHFPN